MSNGVPAIKKAFVACLTEKHQGTGEFRFKIAGQKSRGPVDAARIVRATRKVFAVEWETGNISSSHRALNKMSLGIRDDCLCGGFLVLPSRKLYRYLTDRIGSFEELEPYFPIWRSLDVATKRGILGVIEIELIGSRWMCRGFRKGLTEERWFKSEQRIIRARSAKSKCVTLRSRRPPDFLSSSEGIRCLS